MKSYDENIRRIEMPSETFFKLDSEKQQRVYRAAIKEFCRVPYEQVSIRNIVKTASIPRGSFYQYFIDKEDLFIYIISNINDNGMQIAEYMDIDLFEFIILYARRELDILSYQPYDLSDKAKILQNIAQSPVAIMILDNKIEKNIKADPLLIELLERTNLTSLSVSQMNALVDLMILIIKMAIVQVLNGSKSKEESLNDLNIKLDIIKNGVVNI